MFKVPDPMQVNSCWPDLLTAWFVREGRPLPWRKDRDPYRVWVAEIMLQQTRIETVIPYYLRFMKDYPTVSDLSAAPLEEVLKHWEGLGYYTRARNLHQAAAKIAAFKSEGKYPASGGFPDTQSEIAKLPGIGAYTAGAIAAISFSEPVAAVDGNVMRVVSRLYAKDDDVMLEKTKRGISRLLLDIYPKDTPAFFVEGLMELGELICLPSKPKCGDCPLRNTCLALDEGRTEQLPVRIPKTKRITEQRLVLWCRKDDRVLIARRPKNGLLGGLWELPGVLECEEPEAAFKEAYGIDVRPVRPLKKNKHVFTHITWDMTLWEAEILSLPAEEEAGQELRLVTMNELNDEIMLPAAFRKLIDHL